MSHFTVTDLFCPDMLIIPPCCLCCRDHPRSRGEGLEDGLLLLLRGLRGLRLHRQPQSHHGAQIHAPVQNCSQLVSRSSTSQRPRVGMVGTLLSFYMLICFRPEEVQSLISGKLALRYAGRQASTKQNTFLSNAASC